MQIEYFHLAWSSNAVEKRPSCSCPCGRCSCLLLFLVVHKFDVVLGDVLVLFQEELLDFIANVALNDNFLPSTRNLGNRRAGSKLLAKVLGHLAS